MDLEDLLAEPPAAHIDGNGRPMPFGTAPEVLRLIDESVSERSRTLETGAGVSTALFAITRTDHICVVPFGAEIERIRAWCREKGVADDRIAFYEERSESALPRMDSTPLDLVLIDGAHSFPAPFIDWYYAGRRLRQGGLLVIDDTHLWTGRVLRDYLREQPGWEQFASIPMRAAVFRRTGDEGPLQEWVHQPFVVRRSYERGWRGGVRRAVKTGSLLRSGQLRELLRRATAR